MSRPLWAEPPTATTSSLNYEDSLDDVETGIALPTFIGGQFSYIRPSLMARYRIQTDAIHLSATVFNLNSNAEAAIFCHDPSNDQWSQAAFSGTGLTSTVFPTPFPGSGSRELFIISSMMRSLSGSFIRKIELASGTFLTRLSPTSTTGKKMLWIYHDSIPEQVQSGNIGQISTIGRLRSLTTGTIVLCEGYGGRGLASDRAFLTGVAHSLRGAIMATGISGSNVKALIQVGTNDFNGGYVTSSTFQSDYIELLRNIVSVDPQIDINIQLMFTRSNMTNATPENLGAYHSAAINAKNTVNPTNCSIISGTFIQISDLVDGVHLQNMAHQKVAQQWIFSMSLA